jgi:SAM-dependent methyltransferase
MTSDAISREQFLKEYRCIRHAEGRGSDGSEYYRALPGCKAGDPNAAMWAMRSRTYSYFEENILLPLEKRMQRPLDILDLGAGNCWLSHRFSLRHHHTVAIDIFSDDLDGLRCARHYPAPLAVVEADFNDLPVAAHSFDLAVFNASVHYSSDYNRTFSEVRGCLRPGGIVVVLDSPVYQLRKHGELMVGEKHEEFRKRYGFPSDALPSIEFLDVPALRRLERSAGIEWHIFKPWYGWSWHLRPLKAFLRGRRPPSRFWILVGRFRA